MKVKINGYEYQIIDDLEFLKLQQKELEIRKKLRDLDIVEQRDEYKITLRKWNRVARRLRKLEQKFLPRVGMMTRSEFESYKELNNTLRNPAKIEEKLEA